MTAPPGHPAPDLLARLVAAGQVRGVPPALADALAAAALGRPEQASTERLAAIPGVGAGRASRLAGALAGAGERLALAALLDAAGLPLRWTAAAAAELGPEPAGVLAADPWQLLRLPACRPPQADALARVVLDRPSRADPRRAAGLTAHLLTRAAADGHTALPARTVAAALSGLEVPDPAAGMAAAVDGGRVRRWPAADLLALERYAAAEAAVAAGVRRLLAGARPLAGPEDAESVSSGLDPAQAAAVRAAAAHGVSLLTGGPGTGKSRTVGAAVALARRRRRRVALGAPTGRAAKRLEELTGEPAATLHRLLGAQGTTGQFLRGPDWPLDADLVVVDEASMLDAELAATLLAACPTGAHLVLVGDPAQLPSIGAGRVLGDLLESGLVPATELVTLHRQAEGGTIARLATAVRGGELPPVDDPTREVVVVPAGDSAQAARRTVQLVTDSIPRVLAIPADQVQVVTPVHRGPAGTVALNAALKAVLNPGPGAVAGFDIGDRVVATANHVDEGFANGEVGVVTAAADGGLVVAFAAGPVTVEPAAAADLRHGWALTVHRAQGSEWPAVVAVLPGEASGLLSRPLVYTAFTRASRHLSVVHAAGPALAGAVRRVGARPRRTRLTALLGEAAGESGRTADSGDPPGAD